MAKSSRQETVEEWEDSLGEPFRAGDLIAVAVINGRSPQMVIAEVERINTTNPKGERHTKRVRTGRKVPQEYQRREYVGPPMEDRHGPGIRTLAEQRAIDQRNREKQYDKANWKHWTETRMVDEWHEVQNVTVTATPILDGRGFHRSNAQQKWVWDEDKQTGEWVTDPSKPKTRPVTYTLIGNIIKLPPHVTKRSVEELAAKREVEY